MQWEGTITWYTAATSAKIPLIGTTLNVPAVGSGAGFLAAVFAVAATAAAEESADSDARRRS